jgi:tetratricopeptide (TPR) repeat protein
MLLVVMLFTVAVGAAGDEPSLSELEARLKKSAGTERLEILNQLAYRSSFVSVDTGKRYGQEALKLARALQDRGGEAAAERNLAVSDSVAGNHQGSLEHATRALQLFREVGDRKGAASSLNVMGVCHRLMGHYDQALELYERSLAIDRQLGNLKGVARTLGNVANVHYDRGDFATAFEIHTEELEIERKLNSLPGISKALNNIGIALYQMGDYDGALEKLLASLKMDEEAGNEGGVAGSSANIGNIFQDMGQLDRALQYFKRAMELYEKVGNRSGVAGVHTNLGNLYQAKKRYSEAEEEYRQALVMAREQSSRWDIAATYDNLGVVNRNRGRLAAALRLHRQALAEWESLGVKDGIARSSQNIGETLELMGKHREALPHLERAVRLAEEINDPDRLSEAGALLAQVRAALGDYRDALDAYRKAAKAHETKLNERSNRRVQELEARFQTEKKQREIDLLAKENELERLRSSRARLRANLVIVGLALALLVLGWLGYRYRSLLGFWRKSSHIGHYRILDRIASGGMGVVYLAQDGADGSRRFAVKVIRDELAADETVRRRFLHEAAVIDQLDDPHVVRVHERGEHDGRLFMAMELLDGRSLADVISEPEPTAVADALHILGQLAETVSHLHAKGILHRDLKPGNVLLIQRDGDASFVKLLDFGLARTQSLTRLTQTGMLVGTIGYVAPEVITEQRFSPASDLYALGVIGYELITGRPAFPGDTPVEIIKQILDVDPVPPVRYRPEIGHKLDHLILGMMAKKPEERPAEAMVHGQIAELLMSLGGPED